MNFSAVMWGLEELHIVLRDETSLSVQSSLQPARLLRRVNCRERREKEEMRALTGEVVRVCEKFGEGVQLFIKLNMI